MAITYILERSKAGIRNAVTLLLVWISNQFREAVGDIILHGLELTYPIQMYDHNKETEAVKNF